MVENKFDQINQYNRGLAAARRGDLYGYINREKDTAIEVAKSLFDVLNKFRK